MCVIVVVAHHWSLSLSRLLRSMQVKAVGKDRLVLDLSCKKHGGEYRVATDRWQNISSLAVNQESLARLGQSCAEFLVHGVDVEGKQSGIDEELVELLAEQSPIPVTYAGGVSSMVSLRSKPLQLKPKLPVETSVCSCLHAYLQQHARRYFTLQDCIANTC